MFTSNDDDRFRFGLDLLVGSPAAYAKPSPNGAVGHIDQLAAMSST
jgi:hypothetical protein